VLARGLHILTQQQLMVDQNQAATTAAAAAAAAADEAAGDGPGGSGVPGSSSSQPAKAVAAAAKKADKAAMGRALWLLEKVFLWRQQIQQQQGAPSGLAGVPNDDNRSSSGSAVAGGVCQLLLALSELLRPAANCSVEWRCGALSVILNTVEAFMEQHAGRQARGGFDKSCLGKLAMPNS
jgi:hypothetical protein